MTLSTSDIEKRKKNCIRTAAIFSVSALVCAAFCFVYEYNSHGVHSYYIEYASVGPVLASVAWLVLGTTKKNVYISRLFEFLLNAACITLALGGIVKGIIELYGTNNSKLWLYYVACVVLASLSVIEFLVSNFRARRQRREAREVANS